MDAAADAFRLVPDCRVSVGGSKLSPANDAALTRVSVDLDVELFGQCTLVFNDPQLRLINGRDFEAGAKIKVEIGFAHKLEKVFEGEVVALEPQFRRDLPPSLEVRCFESIHRLALSQMTRTFNDADEREIATKIARQHGLTAEAPRGTKEHVLQSNVSDATFLRRLAQKHGNHLRIEGKKLIVGPPPRAGEVAIAPGAGVKKVRVQLKSGQQVAGISVHGWDPKAKREISGKADATGEARAHGKGMLSFAGHEHAPADVASAEAMAKGRMRKLADGAAVAQVEMIGNPKVKPGAILSFGKMGAQIDGRYRVEKARHEFSRFGYGVSFRAVRIGKNLAPGKTRPPPAGDPASGPVSLAWVQQRAHPRQQVDLKVSGTKEVEIHAIYEDGTNEIATRLRVSGGKASWKIPPLQHLHELKTQAHEHRCPQYQIVAGKTKSALLDLGYDLEWDFKHPDGKKLGAEKYKLTCADGSVIEGHLKAGHLSAMVPAGHVHVHIEGFGDADELPLNEHAHEEPVHGKLTDAKWSVPRAAPGQDVQLLVSGADHGALFEIHARYEDGATETVDTLHSPKGSAHWTVPPLSHLHELPAEGAEPAPHRSPRFFFLAKQGPSEAKSAELDLGYDLEWDFRHPDGTPLAGEQVRLHCADGSVIEAKLSAGHLSARVPAGHVHFEIASGHDLDALLNAPAGEPAAESQGRPSAGGRASD